MKFVFYGNLKKKDSTGCVLMRLKVAMLIKKLNRIIALAGK